MVRDIANTIINELQRENVIIIVGDCSIDYDGRARSYVQGRHSVHLNPDDSVIVHDSTSVQPKNWQPSDGSISINIDDENNLIIESKRNNPDEILHIKFTNIVNHVTYEPTDENIDLKGSEKEIHRYIFANPSIIHDDFTPIKLEKKVSSGRIDVFGKINGKETIIEVKRRKAQQDSVGQLKRYVDCFNKNVHGYIVAPDITDQAKENAINKYDFNFIQISKDQIFD